MEERTRVIGTCELFYGIDEERIRQMMDCLNCTKRKFSAGETVWRSGLRVTQVAIVISGRIHLESCDFWGNKSIITECIAGSSFGAPYALAKKDLLVFDVVAKENSEILFVDIESIKSPCSKNCTAHKQLIENLLSLVATKARDLELKISHICNRTTRDKLISYLSSEARKQGSSYIRIPFNRQELADYLSVERCAMSKQLHQMRRDGLIDFAGNDFVLKIN